MFGLFFRVSSSNVGETQNLSFCKGLKLLESNCVDNVLQVGKLKHFETSLSLSFYFWWMRQKNRTIKVSRFDSMQINKSHCLAEKNLNTFLNLRKSFNVIFHNVQQNINRKKERKNRNGPFCQKESEHSTTTVIQIIAYVRCILALVLILLL